MPLEIVSRAEWRAEPPKEEKPKAWKIEKPLVIPVVKIFSINTHGKSCETKAECAALLRKIQQAHMVKNHLYDIRYNFMIGGDAKVYEGRGWEKTAWLPTQYRRYNVCGYLFAFIGEFKEHEIPDELNQVKEDLINFGLENKFIDPQYERVSLMRSISFLC